MQTVDNHIQNIAFSGHGYCRAIAEFAEYTQILVINRIGICRYTLNLRK